MFGKKMFFALVFALMNLVYSSAVLAQSDSLDGVWTKTTEESVSRRDSAKRLIIPAKYETFRLNKTILNEIVKSAPSEFSSMARREAATILTIPMSDGRFERFRIVESPIMEAELAAKHPELKTYSGQGIDNPTALTRFDITPVGFRAIVHSSAGTEFIEPYAQGNTTDYISFNKTDLVREGDKFYCETGGEIGVQSEQFRLLGVDNWVSNGSILRTYRLALAATGEYTNVFRQAGDTDEQAKSRALTAMLTTMNRVNSVYERELAIRMILVAATESIIYTNGATDPYSNTSGSSMLNENQSNLDSMIGSANYDIGHVFSTGGGGVATLNSPCEPSTKARGVTGLPDPTGDAFAIDYVAHEMGHQFGATHTFNAVTGACGGTNNRTPASSVEPGSGVSIMGYAGICGSQDLAYHSLDTFHVKSLEQILFFVENVGMCSINSDTGNSLPSISSIGGTTWNIPKQTPFALTAIGSDSNTDSFTFDWNQYDTGGTSGTIAVPNTDLDGTPRPIFRNYPPTGNGTRYFPSMTYIRNNGNVPPATTGGYMTGELLPAITRTMKFQAVIRDNRMNGGGIASVTVQVNVDGNSGPFTVTSPNSAVSWAGGSTQTVTWNTANTNNAPVSAANVKISLSTDGGFTFPTVLAQSTANDGSESVNIPNVSTSSARIKIEAENNIFFDMSNTNFSISTSTVTTRKLYDFDGDGKDDIAVFRPSNGSWYLMQSQAGFTGTQFGISIDKTVAADYDGDGKADIAVFRNGNWYSLNSSNGAFNSIQFGIASDKPVTGDFDGDGKSDLTVFRNGYWYIRRSSDGGLRVEQFGNIGDKALTGDYDGDGTADLAVFRPSNGVWYLNRSQTGFTGIQFGIGTDIPAPADFDGDGKTDLAVYRSGSWYLLQSQAGFTSIQFGIGTDIPAPADYDGDGKSDVSVFRPSNGVWYLNRSQAGFTGIQFGTNGDFPVPAPNYDTITP